MSKTYNVGILGATGTVGQRFITLLKTHPFLKIHRLGASSRSAGKTYLKATKWKQSTPCHDGVKEMVIQPCSPEHFEGCHIIFSGLDADVAGEIEAAFRKADFKIFSNAKNYRRDPLVPLLVPTANPAHLQLIRQQQKETGAGGFIVTNSNCSTAGMVVPLAAIQAAFPGLMDSVDVVTLQAISGGGYPGVPSLDILDNVVPFISGEEEKMEWETGKILGHYAEPSIQHAEMSVSASCNRVAVIDGHLGCVTIRYAKEAALPSVAEIVAAMEAWMPLQQSDALPSAPKKAIFVHQDEDRPQPRLDRELEGGYAVSVGRVRELPGGRGVKFICLVHNTVLGAAGMGILNAELAIQHGFI
ncbi:aspartate-semialdehyde dehydrogenase [Protomyces lactucae-debilis]|uniref:Aspartate-semialdehyde dehydrogenase n=1 Tax=Protomyces lactucae-debilis TaxID=2754530 RepID=A0A1Y2EVD5_PROLT|nr:aspartate-semialdehyde dehydrogenase [Protomyces lactucae-debilis]ORY75106.1 aspartate-semialdehyde dehydrogenase [Protomyces lactucae-debilis]